MLPDDPKCASKEEMAEYFKYKTIGFTVIQNQIDFTNWDPLPNLPIFQNYIPFITKSLRNDIF